MSSDRDRLIAIIEKALDEGFKKHTPLTSSFLADYLLANGVIVPPCKVGDTVYCIDEERRVKECRVTRLDIDHNSKVVVVYEEKAFFGRRYGVTADGFGKVIFSDKEEAKAEAELEKRGKENA